MTVLGRGFPDWDWCLSHNSQVHPFGLYREVVVCAHHLFFHSFVCAFVCGHIHSFGEMLFHTWVHCPISALSGEKQAVAH